MDATRTIVAHDEALQKKHAYLNVPAFAVRMVVVFGLWIAAALLLNRWSVAAGRNGRRRRRRGGCARSAGRDWWSFALTVSLAIVDWIMVLERDWYSTVFPAAGHHRRKFCSAFAFCTCCSSWVRP